MVRSAFAFMFALTVPLASGALTHLDTIQPDLASPTSTEIDAQVWTPIKASVVNADIVAMGNLYHSAAVVVTNGGTKAIAPTLKGWAQGMVDAKKKGDKAQVAFRFDKRQDDATTAFETGAFKYTTTDRSGKATSGYTRMEALLIKTNGQWQILMERQLNTITEAAWDQLPH